MATTNENSKETWTEIETEISGNLETNFRKLGPKSMATFGGMQWPPLVACNGHLWWHAMATLCMCTHCMCHVALKGHIHVRYVQEKLS